LLLMVAGRHITETEVEPLYRDLLRRATWNGLTVLSAGPTGTLSASFGAFEVADVILARDVATRDQESRPCLAFRQKSDPTVFRLSGWLCAPKGQVVERPALAALIDRLRPIGAGGDEALHRVFVAAALARPAEADRAARTRLPGWIGGTAPPELKTGHASRFDHPR